MAALSVLMTHAAVSATGNRFAFSEVWARLDVGVTIFFVISGFLLWRPFAAALLTEGPKPKLRRYFRHRFLRIFPAYWAVLIISYFWFQPDGTIRLGDVIRHATLTQIYTSGPLVRSPIPQAWSLATELSFYLFLPVFAWLVSRVPAASEQQRRRRMWGSLGALFVVAQLFRLGIVVGDFSLVHTVALKAWLPNHLDTFAIGMAMASISVLHRSPQPADGTDGEQAGLLRRLPGWVPAAVGVALFVGITQLDLPKTKLVFTGPQEFLLHLGYAAVASGLVASMIPELTRPSAIRTGLGSSPGRFLGRISYGIYLWQILVIGRYLDRHGNQQFLQSLPRLLAFVVPITLLLATITWFGVERPALQFKDRPFPRFGGWLMVIALLSLAWRLFTFLKITTVIPNFGDPFYYHSQAELLAAGKGFIEPFGHRLTGALTPTAFHPPLFSMWLSIPSWLGTHSYLAHKTMAAFAGVGTVVLAGLLGRRFGGDRAGLIGAAAVGIYPHLWTIDGTLWAEGLFTLVLAGALLVLYQWIDRPRLGRAAVVGGLIGLSALVRGEALLLFPLMIVPVMWRTSELLPRERIKQMFVAGLLGAVVIAPWMIRSLTLLERPVVFASNSDEVIYYANCPDTYYGDLLGFWSFNCQERHRQQFGNEPKEESIRVNYWRDLGVDYAMSHKSRWPVVAAARLGRVWDVYKPGQNLQFMQIEGRPRTWSQIAQWMFWLSAPLSLVGLAVMRRRRVATWPVVSQYVAVSVICVLIYGTIRFRTPADLMAMVLAGVALDRVWAWGSAWLAAPAGTVVPPTRRVDTPRWSAALGAGLAAVGRPVAWVRRCPGWALTAGGIAAVGAFIAAILPGLYRIPGAPMEEGFMLVFPERVLAGAVPNVDFLHLYGPASLYALAGWYRIVGTTLWAERTFGLLQHLAAVGALMFLARRWGRRLMVFVGIVAALVTLTPVGLDALAWDGAVALGLWALVAGFESIERDSRRFSVLAGLLAGLALAFRPDLVVAVALGAGALWWVNRAGRAAGAALLVEQSKPVDDTLGADAEAATAARHGWAPTSVLIGFAIGLIPMLVHLARAGVSASVRGMLIDPVFHLRAGRRLPVPPSWTQIDGALQRLALLAQPRWALAILSPSQQVWFWFWLLPVVVVAVVVVAHRSASRARWSDRSAMLFVFALFGLGLLPQALQRPDSTHLAWVSCVALSLTPIVLYEVIAPRFHRDRRGVASIGAGVAVLAAMLLVIPQFTWRAYDDLLAAGRRDWSSREIHRGDRSFTFDSGPVVGELRTVVAELDRRSTAGQRLFVGPADLRRTPYSDAFVYHLFPELTPATYFIEMDPGVANAPGSRLAGDVASADWLVLSKIWAGWNEPNASAQLGSDAPNRVVAEQFCRVGPPGTYVELWHRCHP